MRALQRAVVMRRWKAGPLVATLTLALVVLGVAFQGATPARAAPGDFAVTPTTLTFPDTYVGGSSSLAVTIKNVSAVTQTPNFAGGAPNDPTNFGASQNCAGVPLAPNDTCQFTYTFEPASAGPKSSSTTIGIDDENFQITMSGTGLFPFTVTPTTLTFPDTNVGSSSSLAVTIKNVSSSTLTPNFAGGAPNDPTNFDASQNCAGVPLAPNDTCQFTYTFEPASAGPKSSSTTIGIDDENFQITMSGTGVSPTAVRMESLSAVRTSRGVSVRWRTASSVDTLGFNVYRERRGQRVRLNHHLMPAAPGVAGRRYSFLDRQPVRRSRYWIQAVSTDGSRTWYGAVSAVRPG